MGDVQFDGDNQMFQMSTNFESLPKGLYDFLQLPEGHLRLVIHTLESFPYITANFSHLAILIDHL